MGELNDAKWNYIAVSHGTSQKTSHFRVSLCLFKPIISVGIRREQGTLGRSSVPRRA